MSTKADQLSQKKKNINISSEIFSHIYKIIIMYFGKQQMPIYQFSYRKPFRYIFAT